MSATPDPEHWTIIIEPAVDGTRWTVYLAPGLFGVAAPREDDAKEASTVSINGQVIACDRVGCGPRTTIGDPS